MIRYGSLLFLSVVGTIALLFITLGCLMQHNWLAMLALIPLVPFPLPVLLAHWAGWISESGFFFSGLIGVAAFAVPTLCYHFGEIPLESLIMTLIGCSIGVFAWLKFVFEYLGDTTT